MTHAPHDPLLQTVSRYADAFADAAGVAHTPIPGLMLVRAHVPGGLDYAISRPLACLVLQGSKRVSQGTDTYDFTAGDSLLITADVPTVSQITQATGEAPYYSLVMDLQLPLVAELLVEMQADAPTRRTPVVVEPTDAEVADAALRLMRLLDRPDALPVLRAQFVREVHYWLLAGSHGAAIRQLGWPDSHAQRIARAVALLRAGFAQPLPVERLAEEAGMSPSAFYQHFREATSLSPRQFQKQLRLIEAKRLMTAEGRSASSAAFAVGYESVQQFTREYRRLFGLPPAADRERERAASR